MPGEGPPVQPMFCFRSPKKGKRGREALAPSRPPRLRGFRRAKLVRLRPKPAVEVPGAPLRVEALPARRGRRGRRGQRGRTHIYRAASASGSPAGKVRTVTFSLHLPPFPRCFTAAPVMPTCREPSTQFGHPRGAKQHPSSRHRRTGAAGAPGAPHGGRHGKASCFDPT